ncbi:hypothetical Protein YC6258_00617 [Gynuella sunshinyii YC6258]|uniref:Uncharacterized protein n=1 Tax=Gynuella sunshinyii YC6258 TaxID=1445510 RepID=A0A0C5VDR8_9GAMM|nr:hypothetical Protein YC6258_00617 [Gynuella sunshinyii YC6258]
MTVTNIKTVDTKTLFIFIYFPAAITQHLVSPAINPADFVPG